MQRIKVTSTSGFVWPVSSWLVQTSIARVIEGLCEEIVGLPLWPLETDVQTWIVWWGRIEDPFETTMLTKLQSRCFSNCIMNRGIDAWQFKEKRGQLYAVVKAFMKLLECIVVEIRGIGRTWHGVLGFYASLMVITFTTLVFNFIPSTLNLAVYWNI